MRVLVRADAGGRLGTGHVMRCLSLADGLALRGASVVFATHSPSGLIERIRGRGHTAVSLGELGGRHASNPAEVWSDSDQEADADRTRITAGDMFDVVVVDHYGLAAPWESQFSDRHRLLAIDDLANRPHDVDVMTDQNWYGPGSETRYDRLVAPDTIRLLGPRYAVLQDAYQLVARPKPAQQPPRRLLISFGGNDLGGETAKVLEGVTAKAFDTLHVDVVVGSPSQVDDELRELVAARRDTELHVAVPSLAPFLARADLAIGASGAATWERFAAGVPAMVTTVAPHQSGVTAALDSEGVTRWLGLVSDTVPLTYRSALADFLEHPITWVPRVVDGFGAARVAESMLPSSTVDLRIRSLEPADAGAVVGLQAEHSCSDEAERGLLGGPTAWRREESAFDRLLAARPAASIIEASGVPIALVLPSNGGIMIQRCVTSQRLRTAIESIGATGPAPSTFE